MKSISVVSKKHGPHQILVDDHDFEVVKTIWLGYFEDETKAAKAYNIAAVRYFGEFANINSL